VTTYARTSSSCDCEAQGWQTLQSKATQAAVEGQLTLGHECGTLDTGSCNPRCYCEIPSLTGNALDECQNDPTPPTAEGYCYINAEADEVPVGNPALVQSCASGDRRHLRFTGQTPKENSAFVVCDQPLPEPAP
jgi:hypothetical protein